MHLMHLWLLFQNVRLAIGHHRPGVHWRQITDAGLPLARRTQ